ncbi:MAG: glycosyltransferase, partial [Chloroflexota bacterium]
AMACGLPILAYDTGALPELVTGKAGEIVPYGGNPWALDPPDIVGLAEAAIKMLNNQSIYRENARQRAEKDLGLDIMVIAYLRALSLVN